MCTNLDRDGEVALRSVNFSTVVPDLRHLLSVLNVKEFVRRDSPGPRYSLVPFVRSYLLHIIRDVYTSIVIVKGMKLS